MAESAQSGGVPPWELHHRLARALEWGHVTPEEMAAELGVALNSVYNYAAGRRVPKRSLLITWALRCGVPVGWLLTGEESPDPDSPTGRWDVGRWGVSTWGRADPAQKPLSECYPGLEVAA